MDKSVCLQCKSEFSELDNELKDDYGICLKCFANTHTTEDKRLKILSKIYFSNLQNNNNLKNPYRKQDDSGSNLEIRFINPALEFDFSKFESYFFIDEQLYVITNKPSYQDYDVKESLSNTLYYNHIKPYYYVIKGLYSGINTGFRDDSNNEIYTGDIIRTKGGNSERDPHTYFKKDRNIPENNKNLYECFGVVSSYSGYTEAYQVALDNHGVFLCHSTELEILGNIFYDLIPNKPINIWGKACQIGQSADFWKKNTRDSIKENLSKIKTPSFIKVSPNKTHKFNFNIFSILRKMF